MLIKDIVEGYFVLRRLKKLGYVEEDGLGMKDFIELVCNAERNIRNHEEVQHEEE